MAKHSPGKSALEAIGLPPDLQPQEAVTRLRELRAQAAVPEGLIAAAAGEIAGDDAALLLAEMEPGTSGEARRQIRRAMFRLREHGIAIPTLGSPQSQAVWHQPAEPLSALMSSIDPSGGQIVWLIRERAQRGLTRIEAVVSDEGLLMSRLNSLSRRELRADRHSLEERFATRLVDCDWHLADFILCEAYRRTPEAARARVGDFLLQRAELTDAPPPPAEFHHPVYDELKLEPQSEPSPELLKDDNLGQWLFDPALLKPFVDEVVEIRHSPLVLNRYQQEERINEVVGRALDTLFEGARGERARRRLEDSAYYLAHAEREPVARWALAAAMALREHGDLKRIGFFRQLVTSKLGGVLEEQQQHEQEEPRLIMTPAEAMRGSGRPPRR